MREKRRTERLFSKSPITITYQHIGNEPPRRKIIHHTSKDISPHGVRILTPVFLPVDSLLNIEVQLENPPRVLITRGRIRWIKNLYSNEMFEMGIEFINPSLEFKRALRSHVEKLKLEKMFEEDYLKIN